MSSKSKNFKKETKHLSLNFCKRKIKGLAKSEETTSCKTKTPSLKKFRINIAKNHYRLQNWMHMDQNSPLHLTRWQAVRRLTKIVNSLRNNHRIYLHYRLGNHLIEPPTIFQGQNHESRWRVR